MCTTNQIAFRLCNVYIVPMKGGVIIKTFRSKHTLLAILWTMSVNQPPDLFLVDIFLTRLGILLLCAKSHKHW